MPKRKTYQEIIEDCKKVHGEKYDYSLVKDFVESDLYKGIGTKIPIICRTHGVFYQRYKNHFVNKNGCPKCAKTGVRYTIEEYKEKIKEIFGDDIIVLSEEYVNAHTKLKFYCKKHGEFETKPYYLLQGHTCPKCGREKQAENEKLGENEVIERFINVHQNEYDYSKFKYLGYDTHSTIICHKKRKNGTEHGEFLQTPHAHITGHGCPICNRSKLEKEIGEFLEEQKIEYEEQKHFEWLGLKELDFYLPDYNIVIECQGEQHYRPCNFGSKKITSEEMFTKIKERDYDKKLLCEGNELKVIYYTHHADSDEITFTDTNSLKQFLNNYDTNKQDLLL